MELILEGMIEKNKIRNVNTSLNNGRNNLENVDILKIDTEGHEFQVIKGIKKKLKI